MIWIMRTQFLALLFLLMNSCMGAVKKEDIRKANHGAPEAYQIAEDCQSKNKDTECKVIISYPPGSEKKVRDK